MKILAVYLLVFLSCKSYAQKRERNMTVYGYARVSTDGQTLAAQDAQLHAASLISLRPLAPGRR